jgi:hypothetical protein
VAVFCSVFPQLVPIIIVVPAIIIVVPALIAATAVVHLVLLVVAIPVVSAIVATLVRLPVRLPILVVISELGLVTAVSLFVIRIVRGTRPMAGLPVVHSLRNTVLVSVVGGQIALLIVIALYTVASVPIHSLVFARTLLLSLIVVVLFLILGLAAMIITVMLISGRAARNRQYCYRNHQCCEKSKFLKLFSHKTSLVSFLKKIRARAKLTRARG